MDLDYQMVSEVLLEKVSQFSDDKQLQDYLRVLISEINNQNPYAFNFLIYLFLPLPLPYKFAVKDFEFDKEQEEILDDHRKFLDQKSDDKDQDKNQQDQEDEQEKQTDSELFLSVKTINFDKLHFVIKYFANIKTLKVAIKAAPAATEIAIPIESNLEDDLEEEEGKIAFDLSLWNNKILHNTDERILKLEQRGKVNKYILKACVSILKTIYENDYNYNEEEDLL
jgi:hypothetical protein